MWSANTISSPSYLYLYLEWMKKVTLYGDGSSANSKAEQPLLSELDLFECYKKYPESTCCNYMAVP